MVAGAAVAQNQAVASQGPGKLKLGAGLVYGSKSGMDDDGSEKGGVGINVGGEYFFTEQISAAPSFTYFFKSEAEAYGTTASVRASSLNLDGRYYFANNNGLAFYGLAGIAVGFAKVEMDVEGYGAISESDNKVGVNVGAGLIYPLQDNLDLVAQIKYNTPLEQLAVQVGIAFPIN